MAVEALFRINHRQRLLAGGGIVQIDQRPSVDRLVENREVLPHPLDIKIGGPFLMLAFAHGMMSGRHDILGWDAAPQRFILTSRAALSRFRRGSDFTCPIISAANASTSRLRASASPRPRERR